MQQDSSAAAGAGSVGSKAGSGPGPDGIGPISSLKTAHTKVATSGGHANTQPPSKRSSSGADGDYQLVQHEVLYSLSAEYEVGSALYNVYRRILKRRFPVCRSLSSWAAAPLARLSSAGSAAPPRSWPSRSWRTILRMRGRARSRYRSFRASARRMPTSSILCGPLSAFSTRTTPAWSLRCWSRTFTIFSSRTSFRRCRSST